MAISENNEIRSNLLQCPLDNNDKLFFTLMDYLNNLFTSKDPEDILRFYDYFDNRDQLIKWMKDRPKGNYRIVEFNNEENDIIVVIPTMDINGKFAKTCRDEIFKGLHIIFVESGIGNYYFNFAHNCNAGIKKAMEYNPKWIVLSNDDMYKIDDVEKLLQQLEKIDNNKFGICYAYPPAKYYSVTKYVSKPRKIRYLINIFLPKDKKIPFIIKNKFKVKYLISGTEITDFFLYKKIFKYTDTISFGILSSKMVEELLHSDGFVYDPVFINCHEESDLAIRIHRSHWQTCWINYKIGFYIGASLGLGFKRTIRDTISSVYFSYKRENENICSVE